MTGPDTANTAHTGGIYRRTGATAPGGDLWRPHHSHFEGWFWRLTDATSGRVVIALLSINRAAGGEPWATAAIASHPDGFSTSAALEGAWAAPDAIGAAEVAHATRGTLRLSLPDASIEFEVVDPRGWPLRLGGVGLAGCVPGLTQYWHPWLLDGQIRGHLIIGGERIALDRATVYAEKNWGPDGFPDKWWWGQAHGFPDPEIGVAFAGGRAGIGRATVIAGSLVAWTGSGVRRIVRPLRPLSIKVGSDGWQLRGAGIEIEGHAPATQAYRLPIPLSDERRNLSDAAHQHLAGSLRLKLTRRGGVVYEGVSELAGLENGSST
ncbi:MAG TPA: tocopherol cyclase family protein [Baekduia sp.]|nr:tocopherol cyclase family protein [Baekduia sp.]